MKNFISTSALTICCLAGLLFLSSNGALKTAKAADGKNKMQSTQADFKGYCQMMQGLWIGEVVWITQTELNDWPGFGKKGDKVTAYEESTIGEGGQVLQGRFHAGPGSGTALIHYDAGAQQIQATDHAFAAGRPLYASCQQVSPDQGTGCQAATQLLEDHHGIRATEANTPFALREPQPEYTHLREFAPEIAVEGLLLEFAQLVGGDPAVAESADTFLQGLLVFAELEIHVAFFPRTQRGSRGSPRMRSEMMFRWICDEPAAIVMDSDCSAS